MSLHYCTLIESIKKCPYRVSTNLKVIFKDQKPPFIQLYCVANNGQIPSSASMQTIFGVLGRIQLIAGYYLIIITGRKRIGKICGHDIWRIEDIDLIPFPKTLLHLNQKQVSLNSYSFHESN